MQPYIWTLRPGKLVSNDHLISTQNFVNEEVENGKHERGKKQVEDEIAKIDVEL